MSLHFKPKHICWSELSRYRSELMGFAMIAILLFHVGGRHNETFAYCLGRCGNIGVDIFLFLSGIGLWFAWSKGTTLRKFYWRRYIRIYPTWLLIACLFFIPRYLDGKTSLVNMFLDIAVNWSFWTVYNELQFWYIPAIMSLYIIAPAYMTLIGRNRAWCWLPVAVMVFCVLMRYDHTLYVSLRHLEIFISRIPIFLIGINVGSWVKNKRTDDASCWTLVAIMFLLSVYACINFAGGLRGRFPLFLERMVYIPLCISLSLLTARLFDHLPRLVLKGLAFIGTVSLEFYLIHVEFIMKQVKTYHLGYWLTVLLTLALTLPLAWVLHKLIDKGVSRLTNSHKSKWTRYTES